MPREAGGGGIGDASTHAENSGIRVPARMTFTLLVAHDDENRKRLDDLVAVDLGQPEPAATALGSSFPPVTQTY